MADLWKLTRFSKTETLPVLVRSGTVDAATYFSTEQDVQNESRANFFKIAHIYKSVKATTPIDVVNNFQWTKTPGSGRVDTPKITLIEKRLLLNSNVANIANSVFAGGESVASFFGGTAVATLQAGVAGGAQNARNLSNILSEKGNESSTSEKILTQTKQAILKGASEVLNSFADNYQSFQLGNPVLNPYDFLYATEKTGFEYVFPYMSNAYADNSISFTDDNDNSILGGISDIAGGFASGVAGIAGAIKPGTYIEKAKQFSMGSKGRTISFKFPLLNTGTFDDILLNWQLIYGLIYQNRPGRVTRAIIDLPVIYEAKIPGMVYMPFSYISNLSVNFLGSRRTVSIKVPIGDFNSGSTTFNAIIPDAYEVNITLEGMNEETRNFLYTNVVNTPVSVNGEQS